MPVRRLLRRATGRRARRWAQGLSIATVSALTAFGVASWQANAAPSPSAPPGTPPAGTAAAPPRVSDPKPVPTGPAGVGRDPLTGTEMDRARDVALAGVAGAPVDVTGAAGAEPLSSGLAPGTNRRAEVLLYDYASDKLIKQVVDLRTGKVAKTYTATGMQPPATPREVAEALKLLTADRLASRLADGFRAATGKAYTGTDQIDVRAHVYSARAADSGAERCGAHRCLSLVVQARDGGEFIDLHDIIIDLSGRTIARLN